MWDNESVVSIETSSTLSLTYRTSTSRNIKSSLSFTIVPQTFHIIHHTVVCISFYRILIPATTPNLNETILFLKPLEHHQDVYAVQTIRYTCYFLWNDVPRWTNAVLSGSVRCIAPTIIVVISGSDQENDNCVIEDHCY